MAIIYNFLIVMGPTIAFTHLRAHPTTHLPTNLVIQSYITSTWAPHRFDKPQNKGKIIFLPILNPTKQQYSYE